MPVRYELLLRFNDRTGVLKGALARYSDGSLMPITPETVGDWIPGVLTDALAANAALTASLAALTTERDTAIADLVARTAERDALQAQIDAAAAAVAGRVESHKARIELIVRGEWPAILALVETMQEPQRSIVTEALYAPYYHLDSPTLAALAQARGWSPAYIKELWAAAGARVV